MTFLARLKPFATRRNLVALAVVAAVIAGYLWFTSGPKMRTVTAHFSQAISIYPGTNVDIMGIPVGSVTSVTAEGGSVRVDMKYDAKYHLPANVDAAIVTPTLVADRFIQLAAPKPPAGAVGDAAATWCYTCTPSGPTLRDGGDIPRVDPVTGKRRTAEPLEIDQVYSSLSDLSTTLGPSGANKDGALAQLLNAGASALKGNGALGNDALKNLAGAMQVLGDSSPQLFDTVNSLAELTGTLQKNDALVNTFLTRLATVSTQLGSESDNLKQALAAIANALGTVQSFVHDNRAALKGDLQQLTTTIGVLNQQKETLGKVLQLAPVGMDNLSEAFDGVSGTVGIRLQLGPMATDLGNVICGILTVNKMPNVQQTCTLLRALLPGNTNIGAGVSPRTSSAAPAPAGGLAGILNPVLKGLTR